ncbi:MAG: YebC/PmpR family DNA-binding transcriptional regulator, partial [Planctomycetota bacterium]
LEAGADDIADADEAWHITTAPSEYAAVRDALEAAGLEIDSAELAMVPDNHVAVDGKDAEKVLAFIELIEDHDDVQKLHHNAEIDDAEMAGLSE